MSRLIDADALIKHLEDWRKNWEDSENSYEKAWTLTAIDFFTNLVNNKPTAYNVDKVVEELEDHKVRYGELQFAHNDANMVCVYVGKEQAVDCAIDIVKRGGVE